MFIIRIIKKFNRILSRHQKIRIIILGFLMVFSGFLEMLSVTLVLPFMQVVTNPQEMMHYKAVTIICSLFGITESTTVLVLLSMILAASYVLKNMMLLTQLKYQKRFVYNNMFITQKRILRKYLNRPYSFYLSAKSGEIIRVINDDVSSAFYKLTELLQFFSELVISVTLAITVLIISPVISCMMACVLLLLVLFIFHFVRPMQAKNGENSRTAVAEMNQWLMQAVHGIKEIKILDSEEYFEDKYKKAGWMYVGALYRREMLQSIPKYLIETVMMSSFFILIAWMIRFGNNIDAIIPTLTAIALAAVRILPSVTMISSRLSLLAYGEPVIDQMIVDLEEVEHDQNISNENESNIITTFNDTLVMDGVSYHYPNNEELVLDNAMLEIKKGKSIGVVGTSGSGKTTAIDILLGLLTPTKGKVKIDGIDILSDISGFHNLVGYIPQSIFIIDGTIRENVAFGVDHNVDDNLVWKSLREAQMEDVVQQMPDGLDTQLGERGMRLSGGQIQRIGIARALYRKPLILILDEATSALDSETEKSIMSAIDSLKGNITMVIIAHRLTTIENCDEVYKVDSGNIQRIKAY